MTVAFELEGELVGTIRAVPMDRGLSLAEGLLRQALPDSEHPLLDGWEVGRLVIHPAFRSGVEALGRCLLMSLNVLRDAVDAGHLYAACTPELARLYRRFGYKLLASGVPLAGTDKTYSLIHGQCDQVIAALGGAPAEPRTRTLTSVYA